MRLNFCFQHEKDNFGNIKLHKIERSQRNWTNTQDSKLQFRLKSLKHFNCEENLLVVRKSKFYQLQLLTV